MVVIAQRDIDFITSYVLRDGVNKNLSEKKTGS